jgi:hypothetical protein
MSFFVLLWGGQVRRRMTLCVKGLVGLVPPTLQLMDADGKPSKTERQMTEVMSSHGAPPHFLSQHFIIFVERLVVIDVQRLFSVFFEVRPTQTDTN